MESLISIYEANSCCSSGSCCSGSVLDTNYSDFEEAMNILKRLGCKIERYDMTKNLRKFRENRDVIKLIHDHQMKALPITIINGKVIKFGNYPSYNELTSSIQ